MGACALLWCLGVWAEWQGVVESHGGRRLLTAGCFVWRRFGGFYLRGGVAGSSHIDSLVGAMS